MKRKQRFVCLILTFILVLGTSSNAFAANKKLIDQVKNEYAKYENKAANTYETYRQKTVKEYEQYKENELKSFERFVSQTSRDSTTLQQFLQEDLTRLENQYGDNKEFTSKLKNYRSKISPTSLASPMQNYTQSISPTSLNSLMQQFKIAVNEHSLNSPMSHYRIAVNQNSLNSPMSHYKAAANQHSLNSPMSRLKSGSSEHSLNSVMSQYKRGKLSQNNARKQWDALLKKESKDLQNVINKTDRDIRQVKESTDDAILAQKSKTVNGILEQRAKSLQTIADLRKEYFGEGISFEPLIPDLGENNVIIHGEWLALKQPPVLSDSVPLVPVRAVFEKLDPAIKLHKKENVITISKPHLNVVMTLNKNIATVNGKTITLEAAPKLVNGQTMIPLQLISESFNNNVSWDAGNRTVFIK